MTDSLQTQLEKKHQRKIKEIRYTLLEYAWNNYKTEWDMYEIADALNIKLKTAYRILKGGDKK